MGQVVTIVCPAAWNLTSFAKFLEGIAQDELATFSSYDDQLQVVAKDQRWHLILNEVADAQGAAEEYESNEDLDERFRGDVGALHFFDVRFNNVDVVRRLIMAIAREAIGHGETAWIDTDYGWVISAADFLQKTDADPAWDWRKAPAQQ